MIYIPDPSIEMKTRKVAEKKLQEKRQELGQELKRRRMAAKLTQEAVAELAGVPRKEITEVEMGKMDYSVDQFIRYCMALDVPILPLGFDVVIPQSQDKKRPFDIH